MMTFYLSSFDNYNILFSIAHHYNGFPYSTYDFLKHVTTDSLSVNSSSAFSALLIEMF